MRNNRLSRGIKTVLRTLITVPVDLLFLWIAVLNGFVYLTVHCFRPRVRALPRLLFGVTPIISLAYISRALKQRGYVSDTVVIAESSIYTRNDFDVVLVPKRAYPRVFRLLFSHCMVHWFFMRAIWSYDIVHYYFDGGLLRNTLLSHLELFILTCCRKKIVLLPYGSDAFVYDLIPNPIWRHALMLEYGEHGSKASQIQRRVRRMTARADIVIACLVHFINLPRWDILPLTCYPVDTDRLQPLFPVVKTDEPIRIAHAANHRGVKGTVYLLDAVARLNREGHALILDVIEKVPNDEALKRIQACDIYVDQLIFGYAQAALEALSFGKVVISALDSPETDLFRRFSYLNESPVISANTETIYAVLNALLSRRDEWPVIGQLSRDFVEKRHSFAACGDMYEAIYQRVWWDDASVDLINFYNPMMEIPHESTSPTR